MIPIELGEPSLCRELFSLELNHESLTTTLDLIYELRDKSHVRECRNLVDDERRSKKENILIVCNMEEIIIKSGVTSIILRKTMETEKERVCEFREKGKGVGYKWGKY